MIRLRFACAAALVALAGCAPGEEQLAAADHATCVEYGYPMGHPEYGQCRMLVRQMRLEEKTAQSMRAAAALNSYSNYLRSAPRGY
jgi:hypothetical protein